MAAWCHYISPFLFIFLSLPQFLRLSWDTPPGTVYNILTSLWSLPPPNLVVSVVGGVGKSKVRTWVREVLRQGLVRAAQSTGTNTHCVIERTVTTATLALILGLDILKFFTSHISKVSS